MHIIVAGYYYTWQHETLESFVSKSLEKNDLKSTIITQIYMFRHVLITKEKMEEICLGKSDWRGDTLKESVNDDLESVFKHLQQGIEPASENDTFYVPKLSQEELKLVEQADQDYFQTFYNFKNPDVEDKEMKLSESNSKYISGYCWRWTYRIYKL